MPRRKQSRPSPSQKGHGSNNRFANRYSHANPATPTNGRRGKAQRLLLLGDDFDLDPYDGPGSSLGRHYNLTLQQEARNTEERSFRRNDDRKLRQLGITFVRPQQTDDLAGETSTVPPAAVSDQPCENTYAPPLPLEKTLKGSELPTTDTPPFRQSDSPQVGLLPQNDLGSHLQIQNESSSSEEEVVFVPRNQRRTDGAQSKSQSSKAQHTAPSETYSTAISPPRNPKSPKKTRRNLRRSSEEDEILADYIRNLEENGEDVGGVFSLRPLGSHLDDIDTGNESSHRQEARPSPYGLEYSEAEVYFDVAVAAVIGKRSGEFGTEYHFKPAGSTVEEALWLEGTDMTRDIQHLIDHFEAGLDDTEDFSSVLEDSDLRISDDQGDIDQELAKILQLEGRDGEEEEDDDFDAEDLMNMMLGKPNKQGKFPRASKLADAYDDFDITSRERASLSGPFNRKSRKAGIGRFSNKPVNLDMDDDEAELHIELERYILQDREKKKIRKQERDVRRQSGMLGNSSTPTKSASMDIKSYPGGTSLSKVHTSIKQFLMSGFAERLSLPPMHKQDRVQIHILAHKFFMESKSQGKGNGRFPVLYKTKQTRLFEGDEEAIEIVLSRPGGRGLRGVFGNSRSKAGRQLSSGGGGRINPNKEGMVVGTGAAELSQGNKGYDMLSKMGWTTGTGLGSNRSGILDPVQAIVKNSRAGLG